MKFPKTGFIGITTLHFGVYYAIATFNNGQTVKCTVFQKLDMSIGKNTVNAMKAMDKVRLQDSTQATTELKKKAR